MNTDGPNKLCVATVTGRCCDLLKAERVALNVVSRASGVATIVSAFIYRTGYIYTMNVAVVCYISHPIVHRLVS